MKQIITILSLLFVSAFANAQGIYNALLDDSFGTQGIAIANPGNPYYIEVTATALQPDGRIVMAGTVDSANWKVAFAMRFNYDGSRDLTFASGGYVGKVIGYTTDSIVAIARQADGKIVAAGFTNAGAFEPENILVLRFDSTGVLDHTFGTNGRVVIASGSLNLMARGVAIQNDQKIVLAGSGQTGASSPNAFLVARLTTTGGLDNTFGNGGATKTVFSGNGDNAYALVIQPDQKIVLAGLTETQAPTFGEDFNTLALARYTTTGVLDTFGAGGKVTGTLSIVSGYDQVCAVGLQSTGAIVVAGTADDAGNAAHDFAAARFSSAGVLDNTFGYNGISTIDFQQQDDVCYSMAIGPDDYIALAGVTVNATGAMLTSPATAYCTPDGNSYIPWASQGKAISPNNTNGNQIPFTVLIQPDKKILLAGEGFQPGGERIGMIRYYITAPVQPNGISNISNNSFNLYPNPANNQIRIQPTGADAYSNYTVYDALGRNVLTGNMQGQQQLLDVSSLAPGVYLLRLVNGDKEAARSFVIGK